MALTDKQKRFCDEYVIDCNATRAYKAAYPNIKSDEVASAAGTRLLGNVKVKNYIDERLEQISSEKTADAKEVIEYLTSVMRGEQTDEVVLQSGKKNTKVVDSKDRLRAAELLGKRYGLYSEKIDLSGEVGVVIVDDLEE